MTRLLLALAALAAMVAVSSAAPSMTERQLMESLLQKLEKRHEEGPHGHTHGPMETKPPKPMATKPPMETSTADELSKDRLTHEELRELKAVLMALEKRGYKMRQDFAAGTAGDRQYAGYVYETVKTKGITRVMLDDDKEKEYGLTAEDQAQVYVQDLDTSKDWLSLKVVVSTKEGLLYKTVKANDVIILS